MTHKLIKTANYLLVVDDSEIKEGDYTFQEASNLISKYNNAYLKKIIAHLPLNNSPTLEGVDLLPPLEDDVDLMYENMEDSFYEKYDDALHYYSFIEGYNKAKEKYKYREDDMKKAMKYASEITNNKMKYMEDYIQSLQQTKMPVGFESKQPLCFPSHCFRDCDMMCKYPRPQTNTNSQGLIQWVGKYIF